MPILDFSLPSDFQVLMGDVGDGLGQLDLTLAIAGFSVSQPIVDLSTPLIWSAKITLEAVEGFPESLDKVDNYARWQRGRYPIRLFLYGSLVMTLRIRSFHYDADLGQAELTATDILGLLDFERTASSNSDFKQRAQVLYTGQQFYPFMPRSLAVQRVLVNGSLLPDGIQYLTEGQIITSNLPEFQPNGQLDGFTVDQGDGRTNPIQHAQAIVGAIGYWLWCDAHEHIRFAKYPTDAVAPVRRYARSEVEEFKPKEPDFDTSPPSTVTAVGTHLVSVKVLNHNDPEEKKLIPPGFGVTYPIVTEAKGDGGVVVQRTTRDGSDTDPYNRVTVEKSLASLMPDDHPNDNTLAVANARANAADYNEQGYLAQRVTTDSQPLGVIAKDLFPGEIALADTITTEAWTYAEGVPLQQSLITTQPGYAVFADAAAGAGQTFYEGTLTTWTPIGTRKYEQQTIKTKPKGTLATATNPYDATPTIVNPTEPTFVDAPPEAPRKPAPAPVVAKPEKAAANVAPNGEPNSYAGNGSIVRFSCCSGIENARAIAQFQAHLEWQRHAAYNVTRPFDPTVDLGFVPFQREDVHTKGLIKDGYTIAIGSDGLSIAYTGNLIGSIAQVPDPYEARAIVPDLSTPTPALALAPVFALSFAVGVPITPFALVASGGTGTYTYSVSGLPSGLSLVGNVVSGTPGAIGSASITFSVNDGVNTVNQSTSIAVTSAPVPLPFWQLILSAESGCYASESVSLRFLATADSGSFWMDSAGIRPAPPVVTVESGSFWRESAVAAMADSGSYWRESAIVRPIVTVASGSYWRDRAYERLVFTAEAGSYWRESAAAGALDAYTAQWQTNLLAGGGTVSSGTLAATAAFISNLGSTRAKLNLLWHFSGDFVASKYCLIYPSGHPGLVTYSGFVSGQYSEATGLDATAGTEYADLNYVPSTYNAADSVGSLIAYSHSAAQSAFAVGTVDTSNYEFDLAAKFGGDAYFDCYDDSASRVSTANASGSGLYIGNRTGSNYSEITKNGTVIVSGTATNTGSRPNLTLIAFGLNYNYAGTVAKFTAAQRLSLIAIGEGLTSADVATINSAYATFAAAIGRSLP